MPLPIVQDEPSADKYFTGQAAPERSTWQQTADAFGQAISEGATAKITDVLETQRREQIPFQRTLSVEELNEQYQGLGISWDGPKKEQVAEYIALAKRDQIDSEERIKAGPDGYLNAGLRFGASVVAHMVDPVEAGINIGGGALFRAGIAARYGAQALAEAGIAARVGLGAAEGAATQLALEPLNAIHAKEMEADYTAATLASNMFEGAFAGAAFEGIGYGFGKVWNKLKGTKAEKLADNAAISQLMSDRPVNVEPIVRDFAAERTSRVEVPDFSGRTQYRFERFDPGAPKGRKVYLGSSSAPDKFTNLDFTAHGAEGFVDSARVANADAASKYNDAVGNVYELTLGENARILSASEPLGADGQQLLHNAMKMASQEGGPGEGMVRRLLNDINEGRLTPATLNDVLEAAERGGGDPALVMKSLEPTLEKVGFHGLHLEDAEGGVNRFEFFRSALEDVDESGKPRIFESMDSFTGDERLVGGLEPGVREQYTKEALDPKLDQFDEPGSAENYRAWEERGVIAPEAIDKELEAHAADMEANIKELEGLEALSPEDLTELESVRAMEKEQSFGEKLVRAAFSCVLKNG